MVHPFTDQIRNLYFYITAWIFIALIQAVVLIYFFHLPFIISLSDSIVFNFLFSFFGLSLWYMVRYLNVEGKPFQTVFGNYAVVAFVYVGLSVGLAYLLMDNFAAGFDSYMFFLHSTVPIRLLIGSLYFLLLILLYYLIMFYKTIKEKQIQEAELKSVIKETELSMLRSQLNPHFIFNSLNSVNALTIIDPKAAGEMIVKLSTFLRKSLDQDKTGLVSFEEEIETIQLYLDIEKKRFGDKLNLEMDISDSSKGALIPPMLLQPLIENAVKYGVYESLDNVAIGVKADVHGRDLLISIDNPYETGRRKGKRKGIGLKNVSQRLYLTYGREDLMKVIKEDKRFIVELTIPQH